MSPQFWGARKKPEPPGWSCSEAPAPRVLCHRHPGWRSQPPSWASRVPPVTVWVAEPRASRCGKGPWEQGKGRGAARRERSPSAPGSTTGTRVRPEEPPGKSYWDGEGRGGKRESERGWKKKGKKREKRAGKSCGLLPCQFSVCCHSAAEFSFKLS